MEFITTRNTTAVLERYAGYLEDEGFIVTFGSEHNTPALEPIRLRTRDAEGLSEKLRAINWRGACAVAAHQKHPKNQEIFGDPASRAQAWEEGAEIIEKAISL